jgi:hypothetical protein
MKKTPRKQLLRRDLNDIVRAEDGKVSEAKLWANAGKGTAFFLLLNYSEKVIQTWDSLAILLLILIMPDLVKQLIKMKYGTPK